MMSIQEKATRAPNFEPGNLEEPALLLLILASGSLVLRRNKLYGTRLAMKYVFDTNCIIDLEERREDYPHLVKILSKWRVGDIELGVVAISASEKQKGDLYRNTFKDFENKLENVGLRGVEILLPMAYYGVSYYDHALFCDERMSVLEDKIHKILFPDTPFEMPKDDDRKKKIWLNNKCDVQIAWSLIFHKWEILVTRDGDFHEQAKGLQLLGVKEVLSPCEVAKRLAP